MYPGIERHGRTLAKSPSSLRSVRFSERKPLPIGVAIGPLSPIRFFSTESRFSRETKELVRGSTVLGIVCTSHAMGASAASKMRWTASEISGPMPSPGKSVAVTGAGRAAAANARAAEAAGGSAPARARRAAPVSARIAIGAGGGGEGAGGRRGAKPCLGFA